MVKALSFVLTLLPAQALAFEHSHDVSVVPTPPLYAVLPFVALLLAIAVLPLVAAKFWEPNRNKGLVAIVIAMPILVYYLIVRPEEILFHLEEYLGFMVLLWSLYTISGGIVLRGDLKATPEVNTVFLAIGAVAANLFGTTGAAMLLIRPMLKTNMERRRKVHTFIFFTFVVANIGGCLTPLGDPPLYMGFLKGIPFEWTLKLWPEWLFMNGILLTLYYLWDRREYSREWESARRRDIGHVEPIRIQGWINVLLVIGVMATIALSGKFHLSPYLRDGIMVVLGVLSILVTPEEWRKANFFNFHAITEVAVLFIGIFITMIPALVLLEQRGRELGVAHPWHFFWATGSLSAFLDNTPTYLTFLSLAKGVFGVSEARSLVGHGAGELALRGLSVGAVFMGALTYIGNGPNFMVRAIAAEKGPTQVNMPSFGGYMLYSCGILLPLFVAVTLIFLV